MKRFKVTLSIGVTSFVHATHVVREGGWTVFYRGDTIIAEYATVSLLKVEEVRALEDAPSARGR